jgi:hypothetical protein
MAYSTSVMIESAEKKKWEGREATKLSRAAKNDLDNMRRTRGGQVYQYWKGDEIPSRVPDNKASVQLFK